MANVTHAPEQLSNNSKVYAFTHTTVAAVDAVTIPGMTTIVSAVATPKTDVADAFMYVSCTWTGNVLSIKTWKTSGTDPTPIAADAFSKVLSVVVVGY